MSILATAVMYGVLGAISELIVIVVRRLMSDRPEGPPRNVQGLRMVVLVVVMFGGSSILKPHVAEWEAMNAFNKGLSAEPSFAVIEQSHPDLVARVRAKMRAGIQQARKSGDTSAIRNAGLSAFKPFYAELFPEYASSMPDKEVVEFWRIWFQRFKVEAKQDSFAALDALVGDRELKVDEASNVALGRAALRAIAGAIKTPAAAPDPIQVEATRQRLIAKLSVQYGDHVQVLDDPLNPAFNRSIAQAVALSFWDELFAFTDEEAGPFLKTFAPLEAAPFENLQ